LKRHIFYLVDVFAEEKYAGNQLAVVTEAEDLSTAEMQKIANEMHYSETAFILSNVPSNGGFNVRIFMPSIEVPFAGHPTLGTAYVIKRFIASTGHVVLNLKVGQIPVTFQKTRSGEVLWMKQAAPAFGKTYSTQRFAKLLGLTVSDFEAKYPIQEVSTGLPFIIVPLKSITAVKNARVNRELQLELTKESLSGILVFSPQTNSKHNDLHVRVFVDVFGIIEDPATGSGNGCLAAYLSRYKYFGSSIVDVKVEQGIEIMRPSKLHLHVECSSQEQMEVQVGGKVVLVAQGTLV
jgi:trans-2,3-dihydro-3-hydroxyanthranilate isomerase